MITNKLSRLIFVKDDLVFEISIKCLVLNGVVTCFFVHALLCTRNFRLETTSLRGPQFQKCPRVYHVLCLVRRRLVKTQKYFTVIYEVDTEKFVTGYC